MNQIFIIVIALLVGVFIGASSHWAITLAAKVKAWEQSEAKKGEAEAAKIKAALEHDAALVEATAKGIGSLWDKLKADAAAIQAAKAAEQPPAAVPPVAWTPGPAAAPPAPLPDPQTAPPTT